MSSSHHKATIKVNNALDAPALVSFPLGNVPSMEETIIQIGRKGTDKSARTLVTGQLNNVHYKGSDFGEQTHRKNSHNFAIGVLDHHGQFKIYPCNHTFILRPEVDEERKSELLQTLSYNERRENLTNEFGSKKKKRALQAAKTNTISAENISGANELGTMLVASTPAKSEMVEAAERIVLIGSRKKNRKN